MLTALIFTLFCVATLSLLSNHPKCASKIYCCGFILFWLSGSGIIASYLFPSLEDPYLHQETRTWQSSNAIIILGAGTVNEKAMHNVKPSILSYSRLFVGLKEYESCRKAQKQCTIIISGGDPLKNGMSEAAAYQQDLIAVGVPATDIILEDRSLNTYKNAEYCSLILQHHPFDHVVLVTSGIHLKRALTYFAHFAFYPQPVAADYLVTSFHWLPTALSYTLTDLAIHEYYGILQYHVYNLMGWNKSTR